jgi:competence protein ComEC
MVNDIPIDTEHGQMVRVKLLESKRYEAILYFNDKREIEFGDLLRFEGKVKLFNQEKKANLIKQKVIGEISANKIELIGRAEGFSVKGLLFMIRTRMNKSLARLLPSKEAGLASGLILGEKSKISPDTKRFLQASGTSHIIALSGYNITIILGLFLLLRNRFSRMVNLLVPFFFAALFVIMTGASASIVRAGIMGFMPALARFLGRPKNNIIALFLSAAVMVALNPYLLLFDVGFQLSFAAMIGLTYLTPIIQTKINSKLLAFQIFSETLAAQLAVLPLIIYYFGQVSIISPVSNLIILSLVPLGMLVSFVIGLAGIISPLAGQIIAIPGFVILRLFYILIGFFGSLPFASIRLNFEQPIWIFVLYFLIFDLFFFLKKAGRPAS